MGNFDHLKGLVVTDKRERSNTRTKESKNPEGLTIRIYANGETYPSQELVNEFDLNYYNKGSQSGSGFDVFNSEDWAPLKGQPKTIMVGAVPKHSAKVDLFGTTRFNEQGNPINNVLEQGARNAKLLNLVTQAGYLLLGMKFVDLRVVSEFPVKTEDNIAYVPKEIEKGVEKGKKSYEVRDNAVFYALEVINTTTNTVNEEVNETISQLN